MKILLFIVLASQLFNVLASDESKWVCSDKLSMQIADSEKSKNEFGVWIYNNEVWSSLVFDINHIEKLELFQIEYTIKENNNNCEYKTIKILTPRLHLEFNPPFDARKLKVSAPRNRKTNNVKKRHYMFRVIKTIKGKQTIFYKNFTFNIDRDY